jgi:hypothetical protein
MHARRSFMFSGRSAQSSSNPSSSNSMVLFCVAKAYFFASFFLLLPKTNFLPLFFGGQAAWRRGDHKQAGFAPARLVPFPFSGPVDPPAKKTPCSYSRATAVRRSLKCVGLCAYRDLLFFGGGGTGAMRLREPFWRRQGRGSEGSRSSREPLY